MFLLLLANGYLPCRLPNVYQQAVNVSAVGQVSDREQEDMQPQELPSSAQSPAVRQAEGPANSNSTDAVLHMLQDISNKRFSQLAQHAGSGRNITKRKFEVILPMVQLPPPPESETKSAAMTPHHAALATPQATLSAATVSRASAYSKASNALSCGTAMEGVPERPWRSIGKTPQTTASPALSLALSQTPMEGVLERVEQPNSAVRRQSYNGRLRTPGSTGKAHGKQLRGSARTQQRASRLGIDSNGTPRPETLLRLQLPAADEAQPLEESPVVGLLETQQQPGDQQQQQATGADQYGSLGFFGSLNTAPPVEDAAGKR